ncbi:Rieske (2Fe-2S) domain protein (plasmid) [Novosphingobium aromaticivorans DSM 12444]|uniref:Rieske (2Fe-2S) domain protein n=1 Tax=Novosphingobium aromaticivorans (strain ATCC 700278 / DSM 12444 / CCUG 56034 / CIP 105152 / NBRC 16084 / F199) TaxID=279238 RepID=A4XEG1_NOVAD|nr:Rieske 2Fe-2S domain-containing protein [Novosphingobium aromaticivorans]ABP64322.1 Rieske (2Fe-2S) domain protein [Novosphingobium aromaticivorans DSM 12444]SCY81531.1 3-phenylpropionate/trans-cinnamate dioxygenase ferredoxin subunit [Novosphingobium aromaticivorans]
MSETWHTLIPEGEFPAEGKLSTKIGGWHVLVAKTDDGLHAVNDRCTHQAALLSTGRIRRGAVMCPLHGARFEMGSGRCIGGAYKDLRTFEVRVEDGQVQVLVPDEQPGMDELPVVM